MNATIETATAADKRARDFVMATRAQARAATRFAAQVAEARRAAALYTAA